jgi:cell division protein ZipA
MSELRAALLILGVVFIAALAWWERRRPRHVRPAGVAPAESAERPEPALDLPEIYARDPLMPRDALLARDPPGPHEPLGSRDLLPPREVPAARELPILEMAAPPELVAEPQRPPGAAQSAPDVPLAEPAAEPAAEPTAEPAAESFAESVTESAATIATRLEGADGADGAPATGAGAGTPAVARTQSGDALPELPSAPPPRVEWPPDEERRIVALRLVATPSERFAGRSVRRALAAEGFVLGRFDIFHKPDEERRAVLSAASLTRPGTFDVQTMDSQHYGGLSLFAVLPGPKPLPEAFEELVSTARSLNDRLCGVLQDENGTPLTPARIASLRERIRSGASS